MNHFSDKLHNAPFIRLLVPFIAGIILGESCPPNQKWLYFSLSFFISLLLPFCINRSYKREYLFGTLLFPALFLLGLFIKSDKEYHPQPLPNSNYYAVVDEFPVEKEKSSRVILRLLEPKIKVMAYIDKSVSMENVEPGMIIWFRGQPEVLQKTGNPFEFDYATYAIRTGIGHRLYLKNNNLHFIEGAKNLNLMEWSLVIRDRLIKILETCGLKGEVLHLVSSVSLGAREDLEPEITQSFSKTGVIHVLAVSGMNVAIIFVVLDFLFKFLKQRKGGIILYMVLILSGCWGYSLITGLSASVLRAAAMFTFIVIGKSLSRHPNIYNTLAASAFVLLCFNPSLVYDVGFQLSYVAVFSIVYFHPFLYKLLYFKYWIPDQIWILLSVSLAAQIGTLPFLLHYFHQFPTWFLLANLMVIPLVTLILYLSFIVFAVAPISLFLGYWMARVLDLAGQGMLFSVHFVERLPHSLITGLYPTDFSLFVTVVFAIFLAIFIINQNPKALITALTSIIILLLFNILSTYQTLSRKEVVVFNLQGKTLIALTSGRETTWLTTQNSGTAEKLNYFIAPYEGYRGISKSATICLSDKSILTSNKISRNRNFLIFEGLSLCVLNDRKLNEPDRKSIPLADVLILTKNAPANPQLLRKTFPSAMFIENYSLPKEIETNSINTLNDIPIQNSTLSGAVQITFKRLANGENNILHCGNFDP